MNKKSLLLCCVTIVLAASVAVAAGPRGGSAGRGGVSHFSGSHGPLMHGSAGAFNRGNFNNHSGSDWHHHHRGHDHDDDFFFFGLGFPLFDWGWGYPYWGYPYPYPYGYPSGYYGSGYYGYGDAYHGGGYASHSRVVELQRHLARAGYYHGRIDGVMGPRTRGALRAYRHDHQMG